MDIVETMRLIFICFMVGLAISPIIVICFASLYNICRIMYALMRAPVNKLW